MGLMGMGCGVCGFDEFCFDFLLWVLWLMVVVFDLWLIFVVGCVGLMVVGRGSLWWRWLWFGSDLGGLDKIWWCLGG